MTKYYYLAHNFMASYTSDGFANSWEVLAFKTSEERDEFFERSYSARKIDRNEIRRYIGRPRPFTFERFLIRDTVGDNYYNVEIGIEDNDPLTIDNVYN